MAELTRRQQRMTEVLSQRLGHLSCALEAVHHRHNVSAILRTCDALGIHGVHLVEGRLFRPSKGATRGAERWLDLHRHESATDAIEALQAAGQRVFVADLTDDAVPPSEVPIDEPLCLWFGAEHNGVSPEATEAADGVVMLPMYGFAQSLNVSVAAALVLQQVAQRVRAQPGALLPREVQQQTLAAWIDREEALRFAAKARQRMGRVLP